MSVCYVLSDSFYEKLVKDVDRGEVSEIIGTLKKRKQTADTAGEILEQKTLQGTRRV